MNDLIQIGYIVKAKGLKGAVKVSFEAFFLDFLAENAADCIFVKSKTGIVPYFIEKTNFKALPYPLVHFEDVDTREKAQRIEKCAIYFEQAPLQMYIDQEAEEWTWADLIGFTLLKTDGSELGKIEEIFDLPQQEVAQVFYKGEEVLIPLNEDFIQDLDMDKRELTVELPEGLLELYIDKE